MPNLEVDVDVERMTVPESARHIGQSKVVITSATRPSGPGVPYTHAVRREQMHDKSQPNYGR